MKSDKQIINEIEKGIKEALEKGLEPKLILLGNLSHFSLTMAIKTKENPDWKIERQRMLGSSEPQIISFRGIEVCVNRLQPSAGTYKEESERVLILS